MRMQSRSRMVTHGRILATMISVAALMIGLLVWYFTMPNDCWQRFNTEQEAILNCEQPQQNKTTATQIKELHLTHAK